MRPIYPTSGQPRRKLEISLWSYVKTLFRQRGAYLDVLWADLQVDRVSCPKSQKFPRTIPRPETGELDDLLSGGRLQHMLWALQASVQPTQITAACAKYALNYILCAVHHEEC